MGKRDTRDRADKTFAHQLQESGGSHTAAGFHGRLLPLHPAAADAPTHPDAAAAATGASVTHPDAAADAAGTSVAAAAPSVTPATVPALTFRVLETLHPRHV